MKTSKYSRGWYIRMAIMMTIMCAGLIYGILMRFQGELQALFAGNLF